MPPPLPAVTLTGRLVRLEPLSVDHVEGLAAATAGDRSSYGLAPVPHGVEATRAYVERLLDEAAAGTTVPFAQISVETEEVVGSTRLLDLQWRRGRPEPDEVEVGSTFLAPSVQRTGINTEAKLLLLTYAFDTLGVWRVGIMTDERNIRSRAAIERIGATFEGVLRNFRLVADSPVPAPRQTAVYSIIDSEWPSVRDRLERLLRT